MRILNSICKVLASKYAGKPVHIEQVPNGFKRDSFLVTLATDSGSIKSYNVYQDNPIYQIVYFGERNEANQVIVDSLYRVKEELKELFLLSLALPIIPKDELEKKKPRYAKIETYTDDLRLDEGALYVKITLNFTEDVPHTDPYDLIGEVDLETITKTNG